MKIRLFTIPNLLTLGNLLCGSAAAVLTLVHGNLTAAFWLIIVAVICDFLDGFAARLLGQSSPMGVELDSLADMVSFGVAPAAVLYELFISNGGDPYWGFVVFVLAACSALRLGKFNIDENQSTQFIGMPTPAAALMVASSGYLVGTGMYAVNPWFAVLLAFVLSYLLVCKVPMFALKFKHYGFRGNEVRYLFAGCAVVALVIWQILAIPFIILAYVALSMVLMVVNFRKS